MLNDLRFAARLLLRSPAFTTAAAIVLTLGIGAATTMFSATNAVLFRPLPYPDASRLFVVREARTQAGFERTVMSAREYLEVVRPSRALEHPTLVTFPGVALAFEGASDRVPALRVSADFFPLFGVTPVVGRPFTADAEVPGQGDVLLVSHRIWQERLGGAPGAVGRTVRVEGRPATIIGVLPPAFSFQSSRVDLVVPLTFTPELKKGGDHSWDVYARLAPGVTQEQAAGELSRAAIAAQDPVHLTGMALVPMKQELVGDTEAPMLVMFAAVGCVLLIACANIANLLLARGHARQREIAIRVALGAGRARVVRQLVTESLLLSGLGGLGGALLATWLTDALGRSATLSIPRADEIAVDGRGLLFAVAVSIVAGLLFGLAPAWHASRTDVNATLKQEGRGSSGSRQRALSVFVIGEIALALVLLIGAGLLLTTFAALRRVDPGFDASRVLVVPAFLPDWKYATGDQQREFFRRATAALSATPGVEAVGATNALPLSGDNSSGSLTIEGAPPPSPADRPNADRRAVTPGYFAAMGMHVIAGRALADQDDERAQLVVVVSKGFADRYWPGQAGVGKRVKLGRYETVAPWRVVTGVVNDVRHGDLTEHPRPVVYYPHAQGPDAAMQLVVRAASSPAAIAGAVRKTIERLDPDLPVNQARPLSGFVHDALADYTLALSMLGSFAAMALLLAAAGIYGVMAYAVAQRRQEFGIRLALGASAGDVLRLVAMQGIRLTAAGLVLGLCGAALTTSALQGMIYGVSATDPGVFAATSVLLAAIAMAACLVPALRALRVDPISALRAH